MAETTRKTIWTCAFRVLSLGFGGFEVEGFGRCLCVWQTESLTRQKKGPGVGFGVEDLSVCILEDTVEHIAALLGLDVGCIAGKDCEIVLVKARVVHEVVWREAEMDDDRIIILIL